MIKVSNSREAAVAESVARELTLVWLHADPDINDFLRRLTRLVFSSFFYTRLLRGFKETLFFQNVLKSPVSISSLPRISPHLTLFGQRSRSRRSFGMCNDYYSVATEHRYKHSCHHHLDFK